MYIYIRKCGWTRLPSVELGKSKTGGGRGAKAIGAAAGMAGRKFFVNWEECGSRREEAKKVEEMLKEYKKRKRPSGAALHSLELVRVNGKIQGLMCAACRLTMWSPGQFAVGSTRPILMRDNCVAPRGDAQPAKPANGAPWTAAKWSRDVLSEAQFKQALAGEMPCAEADV